VVIDHFAFAKRRQIAISKHRRRSSRHPVSFPDRKALASLLVALLIQIEWKSA
jgi:hypothetical protein